MCKCVFSNGKKGPPPLILICSCVVSFAQLGKRLSLRSKVKNLLIRFELEKFDMVVHSFTHSPIHTHAFLCLFLVRFLTLSLA